MNKFIAILIIAFLPNSAFALEEYIIEFANNDETFVINGNVFEAKTYCMGWEAEDTVIFIEGSEDGMCVSAELYNLDEKESCRVWCE